MNGRIRFHGVALLPQGWSRRTGIRTDVLRQRLRAGWSAHRALTTPPRKGEACRLKTRGSGFRAQHYRHRNTVLPLKQWALRLGIETGRLYALIRQRSPVPAMRNGRVQPITLRPVTVYRHGRRALTADGWAKRFGISVRTFRLRLKKSMARSEKFPVPETKSRELARLINPKRKRKRRTATRSEFSCGMAAGMWIVLGAAAMMLEQDRETTTREAIRNVGKLFGGSRTT